MSDTGFPFPAIRRAKDGVYTATFVGRQREPSRPDETGALVVVDQVFGGRVLIIPIRGVPEFAEVRSLPR
jgi:hypothetical protein